MTKKIAIIGSGPAGLSCANKLVSNGFSVTVFDELSEFGGMLAYGIPEFRIPLKNVHTQINVAKKNGIIFENKKIDTIHELINKNNETSDKKFDLVVIAIGAGTGIKAGFENENSSNVIDALDFLLNDKLNNKKMMNGGDIVGIIGGGNSAIDAARVAKKQGALPKIIYRRTENEMPALKKEVSDAKKDLVEFEFLLAPKKLVLAKSDLNNNKCKLICSVMELGEMDSSGRRKPIESKKVKEFDLDKIIIAVGQQNNFEWLEKDGVKTNGKIILIDEHYLTSLKNVYACGDAVTGAKTIGEAVLTGIKCAENIILSTNKLD